MSHLIKHRAGARSAMLAIGLALFIAAPLYANQPVDSAAAKDAVDWVQQNKSLIFFGGLFVSFFGGVIVTLIISRLMRKPAAAQEKPAAVEAKPQAKVEAKPAAPKPSPKPVRSEAVTLLATLQREARFVDFIKEPLDGYSDAQIGAAARDVHRDCAKVLDRLFAIRALNDQEEGSSLEVPAGFDAGRYRLTGNVAGNPPFRGRLVHHGWEAAEVQLPEWSGTQQSARVIAPIEVELT
jgi:hypothetical protein